MGILALAKNVFRTNRKGKGSAHAASTAQAVTHTPTASHRGCYTSRNSLLDDFNDFDPNNSDASSISDFNTPPGSLSRALSPEAFSAHGHGQKMNPLYRQSMHQGNDLGEADEGYLTIHEAMDNTTSTHSTTHGIDSVAMCNHHTPCPGGVCSSSPPTAAAQKAPRPSTIFEGFGGFGGMPPIVAVADVDVVMEETAGVVFGCADRCHGCDCSQCMQLAYTSPSSSASSSASSINAYSSTTTITTTTAAAHTSAGVQAAALFARFQAGHSRMELGGTKHPDNTTATPTVTPEEAAKKALRAERLAKIAAKRAQRKTDEERELFAALAIIDNLSEI